jgi:hypothetical protein
MVHTIFYFSTTLECHRPEDFQARCGTCVLAMLPARRRPHTLAALSICIAASISNNGRKVVLAAAASSSFQAKDQLQFRGVILTDDYETSLFAQALDPRSPETWFQCRTIGFLSASEQMQVYCSGGCKFALHKSPIVNYDKIIIRSGCFLQLAVVMWWSRQVHRRKFPLCNPPM